MRWFLSKNGQITGPTDEAVIATWRNQGQIQPGTSACEEGGTQWIPFERTRLAVAATQAKPKRSGNLALLLLLVPVGALALWGAVAATVGKSTPAAASKPERDSERVNPLSKRTQFEIGEGTNRAIIAEAWPVDGGASFELTAGTLVELLIEQPSHQEPPAYPANYASSRLRISSGRHAGRVVYVRGFQVQAASAGL
ncbi:MAG: DUF4339 domain-containing protein [Methylibium sp.]|nr:DUF4339 domain-containing protein [Methylibium sp.]